MLGASANSHGEGDDFDHLIAYPVACTLKSNNGCAMGHEMLRFESLHEVIKGNILEFLRQGKRCLKQGNRVCSRKALGHALNDAIGRRGRLLERGKRTKKSMNFTQKI